MELREWQYMNKPAANTSSYKKRFTKLINYHISHASSELERIVRKAIKDDSFFLGEHYNNGSDEFDRDIIVNIDKNNDWSFSVFLDGKETAHETGSSWEDLIRALSFYFETPDVGTEDYDDLLTESLNEWRLMNPPKASQSASSSPKNYPSQEDRYKRLLAQIDSDKTCSYTVNLLDDRILAITINSAKGDLGFKIIFKPYVPCYLLQLTAKESVKEISCENFENVLDILLDAGLINNTDLCESISAITEDFKIYENLWENI